MPDAGRLTEDRLPHAAPALAPYYPPPPWPLPGGRVIKVLYETDAAPVLEWLPPKLTRSSPPYAVITVERYTDTPVGPFSAATQFIGCRAGFFVRALALQTVVDSPVALAALREVWGWPATLGEVKVRETKTGVTARVSAGGTGLADVKLSRLEKIAPGLVRFDPVLTLRAAPSLQEGTRHDLLQMVQVDPDYEVKAAQRGSGVVSLGEAWSVLPVRNIVASVSCEVDTELPLARFVMPY
ncbi:MAG TPA: acetoacetate decarboxylase family protein [Dehalococcoidia bacterium]